MAKQIFNFYAPKSGIPDTVTIKNLTKYYVQDDGTLSTDYYDCEYNTSTHMFDISGLTGKDGTGGLVRSPVNTMAYLSGFYIGISGLNSSDQSVGVLFKYTVGDPANLSFIKQLSYGGFQVFDAVGDIIAFDGTMSVSKIYGYSQDDGTFKMIDFNSEVHDITASIYTFM